MTEPQNLIDHLFRRESGKLVSVLTGIFGPHNLELAEDVVQDTLLKALDHWKFHGVPDNPTAWLFTSAKNKALDVIRKERHHKEFAASVSPLLKSEYSASPTLQQLVNENVIEDEQLRMMFVCCHPSLPAEAQVAMILKTLCGFSVAEIAKAFLSNEETITKRLFRGRQKFRDDQIRFELPKESNFSDRLEPVLTSVYLIFSEGYHSAHHASAIRDDLVEESLRLGKMLADHRLTRNGKTLALLSLMCFQAARLYTRVDAEGSLLPLKDQDRSRWNHPLIRQAAFYLEEASEGKEVTEYHLEAAIAQEHCIAANYHDTDWKKIIHLYDLLLIVKPDPIIALNRLIAVGEEKGARFALDQSARLDAPALAQYHLYHAALGEWHFQVGEHAKARTFFESALTLTPSPRERELLQNKIRKLS